MIPPDTCLSDIGSWSASSEISGKDPQGNVCKGDVLVMNLHNSLIHAEQKLVAAVGIDDFIVVEAKDALLVVNDRWDEK